MTHETTKQKKYLPLKDSGREGVRVVQCISCMAWLYDPCSGSEVMADGHTIVCFVFVLFFFFVFFSMYWLYGLAVWLGCMVVHQSGHRGSLVHKGGQN